MEDMPQTQYMQNDQNNISSLVEIKPWNVEPYNLSMEGKEAGPRQPKMETNAWRSYVTGGKHSEGKY